jgi:hypothetical protein
MLQPSKSDITLGGYSVSALITNSLEGSEEDLDHVSQSVGTKSLTRRTTTKALTLCSYLT